MPSFRHGPRPRHPHHRKRARRLAAREAAARTGSKRTRAEDQRADASVSAAAIVVVWWLLRWVFKSTEQPPVPVPIPAKGPIILPPPRPRRPAAVQLTLPFLPPTPVVEWGDEAELLAWRAWRLVWYRSDTGRRGGLCLSSLSAPCIWEGPVVNGGTPLEIIDPPTGVYALKLQLDRVNWQNHEACWVTGDIALSGRVVEHRLGYRAERAVVRELRLAVGTHLAVRDLKELRQVIDKLEDRYQVSVNVGQAERETADRMLAAGKKPERAYIPPVRAQAPWRLI